MSRVLSIAAPAKPVAKEFVVVRDQGYGRVFTRVYASREAAEVGMAAWQREGIESAHPSLILGGDWSIIEREPR